MISCNDVMHDRSPWDRRLSHLYNARGEARRVSSARQTLLAPSTKHREVFGDGGGWKFCELLPQAPGGQGLSRP